MTKVLLPLIIAGIFSLLTVTDCHAQNFPIVQNGRPEASIVISTNVSSTERYAAQELQRAIQKISGAELPITSDVSKSTFTIVIGTPQNNPEIKAANLFNTNNDEETRIVRRGKVLFLAGPTPRAALYAVYTFLQDNLNCRWYWPGESGEYFPRQNNIIVGNLDIRQIPSLKYRSLSIDDPHYDEDTLVWMARNRMNLHNLEGIYPGRISNLHEKGFIVMIGGHNAILPQELLEQHPEYAAYYGGKRHPEGTPQLCWSNAAVQQALAKEISGWWDAHPDVDEISFFPADNPHFCDCDQCKAMSPDVSTRWQKFSKIVIDIVNKTHPGKKYQTLAYQDYRDVPRGGDVAPFQLIGYTTYNINYTKPITDPSNNIARGEIEAWQKLGANMGIRGYQFIPFNQPMYAPIESLVVQEIAWAHKTGLIGWTSEVEPLGYPKNTLPQNQGWITNRLALYAAAQAMWNVDVKPQDIVKDWSSHIFGAAIAPMQDYYTEMENAWQASPQPLGYFLQPPASFVGNFISNRLLQKVDADFQSARQSLNAVKDDATRQRIETQINLESEMLDNWRQTFLYQQGRAGHFQAYAPRATIKPLMTAAANDPAWKDVQLLPDFEDSKNQPATEKTKVLLQWDNGALYLRFICDDNNISQLKTTASGHDGNLWSDDAIELFLDDPSIPGHYFHLAVNAKNVSYDAKADGAMNHDTSWDPDWSTKTSIGTDSWILDVKLPFQSFGITPVENATWKMSFKRDGADRRPNTGWPDASYNNPAGFGTVTLVDKIPQQKRALFYDAGFNGGTLRTELAKLGFTSSVAQDEAGFTDAMGKGVDVVILRAAGAGFTLPGKFITEKIQPFVRNGGLVLVSGYGLIPLDEWFGPEAAAKWDGWDIDLNRHTTSQLEGNWDHQPNDLSDVIKNSITPSSGFTPVAKGWEVLASEKMNSGEEVAYLLRTKIGKGTLVVTSSDMGYAGAAEMFGNMNPGNAAKLVDNLLAGSRKQ